jgi:hypothetical protein
VDENKKLVLQVVNKLNQSVPSLPGKPVWKTRAQNLTYPTHQVLVMAQQAFARGEAYLNKHIATGTETATVAEVMDLMIKLGGTSPEARALTGRMARGRSPRQVNQPR